MRAYRLHDASWSRIVTHRVRRPNLLASRLGTRRRRQPPVPDDGQLVLLRGNHVHDPRSGAVVGRRELLDRVVEALSIPAIDGVVASADLLEDLTLINVLEHRLAICSGPGERAGLSARAIEGAHFDGAQISADDDADRVAAEVFALQASGLPVLVDVARSQNDDRNDFDTHWQDWIPPLRAVTGALSTGSGVWLTLPAISGMTMLAQQSGFPVLVRDTDLPIDPEAWRVLFDRELPMTVRGFVAGPSALFPLEGSVADATTRLIDAVRR